VTALLAVEGLTVDISLDQDVLHPVRGVSLSLARGETLCIVGESGCGKSLTALALLGLLPRAAKRQARRLDFEGEDLLRASGRRMSDLRGNRIGMIFQDPMSSLNPAFTIGNQLEEAMLRHRRVGRGEARARAVFLLEKVGITSAASRLGQYPHQLSGGLRQRVMIAMALMCGPALIVADEPTTALDVTIQAQILLVLAGLQREFGMGLILITHDLGVVARIADRVLVMYAGQVVEEGSVVDIFENPLHPYTRGLLDCIPTPGRTKRGEHLGSIPGLVPSLVGDIAGCSFRDRCPQARPACADFDELRRLGAERAYRCILDPDMPRRADVPLYAGAAS
jgi:peptide/nickel transport system ATP-binding protein